MDQARRKAVIFQQGEGLHRRGFQRSRNVRFAKLSVGGGVLRNHHVLLGLLGQYAKAGKEGLAV
jgi:hypothetical protein